MADFISSNPLVESVHDEEVRRRGGVVVEVRNNLHHVPMSPRTSEVSFPPNSPVRSVHTSTSHMRHSSPLSEYIRHAHHLGLRAEVSKQLEEIDGLLKRGKHVEAIYCIELALLTSSADSSLLTLLWRLLGNAHLSLSQYRKASICFLHHLAFCRELNDFEGITKAECNLGISYMKLGMLKLAGRCFLQYLENSRVLQDNMGIAKALSNLGVLSKTLAARAYEAARRDNSISMENAEANLKRAIGYFEQHLEIVEQYGDVEKQARAYGNLGSCHEMARQYPQAMFCHGKRLEMVRMTSDLSSECYALCNLGNCCRATRKYEEALEYYATSLELSRSMDNTASEVASLLNLGATCELLGRTQKAIEWYTLYFSIVVQQKDLCGQARALATLASLSEDSGDIKKAQLYYTKLVEIFQQLGDQKAVAMATGHITSIMKHKSHRKSKSRSVNQSLENLEVEDSPMVRRGRKPTPHVASGPRSWHKTIPSLSGGAWSAAPAAFILENHRAINTFESGADNLYNDQNMMQVLFEQEAGHSLYKLGGFMDAPHSTNSNVLPFPTTGATHPSLMRPEGRPLPNIPDDRCHGNNHHGAGGVSDYAVINEEAGPSGVKSYDIRKERHLRELKRMTEDFSKPLTELGIESTDREWNQWLEIQGLTDDSTFSRGGSNVEMTTFGKRAHTDTTRAANSVPQSLHVL